MKISAADLLVARRELRIEGRVRVPSPVYIALVRASLAGDTIEVAADLAGHETRAAVSVGRVFYDGDDEGWCDYTLLEVAG
jgi:hypothetical protein